MPDWLAKEKRCGKALPVRIFLLYVFRQLSKAKQKPTRYAGGDKRLYK